MLVSVANHWNPFSLITSGLIKLREMFLFCRVLDEEVRSSAAVSTSVRSSAAVRGGFAAVRSTAAVGGGSTSVRLSAAVGGGSTAVRLSAAAPQQ